MNRILYFTSLFILLLVGCSKDNSNEDSTKENPDESQNGTIEHPFLIKTKQDLIQMRDWINNDNVNYGNKVYKLTADIDLTGEPNWIPIGASKALAFKGIFDGNEKVIKNIHIGTDDIKVEIDNAGIFGYVSGGDIKNLGIKWIRINISGDNAGGVVGYVVGSNITNCYSSGAISSNRATGGIAGYATDCSFSNCYSNGPISSSQNCGGIVGESNSDINGCYSTGSITVSGQESNVGGIAGSADKIENCYSTGNITGHKYTGGIAGFASTIINCSSTGAISATLSSSAISGYKITAAGISSEAALIVNCYSTGNIISSLLNDPYTTEGNVYIAGGVVAFGTNVINCYSVGNISTSSKGHSIAGGIAGQLVARNDINVVNCYSYGDVFSLTTLSNIINGYSYSGGIAGFTASQYDYPNSINLLTNCFTLSKNIKSICASNLNNAYVNRISNTIDLTINLSGNFASNIMIVKKGTSETKLTTITDFTNSKIHGSNLTANSVDLLNKYVDANPTYNGITLLKWKVQAGVNNGNPIFNK